jgi:hypothetical protein
MYILYKVKLMKQGCNYRLEPEQCYKNIGAKEFVINASDESMIRFLRRVRAADSTANPRSKRFLSYKQILDTLSEDGFYLYIFAHRYPKTQNDITKLLGE